MSPKKKAVGLPTDVSSWSDMEDSHALTGDMELSRAARRLLSDSIPICQRSCHLNGLRGDQRALFHRA